MKIRYKVCGDYFYLDDETLALMSDGYLSSGDINTYDEYWGMLNQPSNDLSDLISDADPGI